VFIQEAVMDAFIRAVSKQSLCLEGIDKQVSIVHTPLNGAGLNCVTRVLKENGFANIAIVKAQERPDETSRPAHNPIWKLKRLWSWGLQMSAV